MKTVKIDKRACRKVGAEPLNITKGSGMLYVDNIKYIVRARVKTIAHHRLLVVYFYACERMLAGDWLPIWTVFQSKSDFLVLVRDEEGHTKWSASAMNAYNFRYPRISYACVFYTLSDKTRLERYLHNGRDGIASLFQAQNQIKSVRSKEKRDCRDRRIIEFMRCVPKQPKDLQAWVESEAVPTYLFYDYKRTKAPIPAYCTHCHKTVKITGAKHGKKENCPECGWPAVMKARGRAKRIIDRSTCNVVQKIDPETLLIRTFKIYLFYKNSDLPTADFYENARVFLKYRQDSSSETRPYYYSYGYEGLTKWKKGERPFTHCWGYNFEADDVGHLYYRNLDKELNGTPWQYVPLKAFYLHDRVPMQVPSFLRESLNHPKVEHLIKVGFFKLSADLAYGYVYRYELDETQNRTHRLLKVQKEDLDFLRGIDVNIRQLRIFQKYCSDKIKDRRALLTWLIKQDVTESPDDLLAYMTPYKMMRYLDHQYELLSGKEKPRVDNAFKNMSEVIQEYRDYLYMCGQFHYDLKNTFVLFPDNCHVAHDKVQHRIKLKETAKERRAFKRVYKQIGTDLAFEKNGLKIVFPKGPDELISEGQSLHHCVGSYVDRVANGRCLILFLRKSDDENTPFYTIEVRKGEVVQIRGQYNCKPTPEVEGFMDIWEHRVLQKAVLPEAA